MDKNAIKKYAVWARRELISRVSQKALQYGITEETIVPADAAAVNGVVLSNEEKKQRRALIEKINDKGYQQVMEEVAYTWFNRFIALRFMEVNGYLPSHVRVFTDDENNFKPQILAESINLDFDGLNMDKVYELKDANDNEALFKYLLIVQCNALNPIMPRMFQKISDYTELLFPDNLLREGSVVQQMIELIPEEDWKDAVQIIGWLYQYYNSEKKDEVFAALKKNVKITKENIPAATQLFTPDWIVRYMVENSLGRLWVEGHPNDELKAEWKYYLEEAEQEVDVQAQLATIRKEYASITPEQIKCTDPCSGSGHILAYMFDVLMQIYEAYGYTAREAVRSIVENNIYGLDIDDRAAQLAYFSVMMKARQYDRRFLTRKDEDDNPDVPQPHVYAIVESNGIDVFVLDYFANNDLKLKKAINSIVHEMRDAKDYGSILNISPVDFEALYVRFNEIYNDISICREAAINDILPLIHVAQVLSQRYDVVVTNPPYMGMANMNAKLVAFIKENYEPYKSDFFSAFIVKCTTMAKPIGKLGFFTPYVWMFLQSYEGLRLQLFNQRTIESLIQFEYSAFEEATVPVCTFSFSNAHTNKKGSYIRLTDFRGGMEVQREKTLYAIHNHSCGYYYEQSTDAFASIPGSPVAYWASKQLLEDFESGVSLGDLAKPRQGMATTNNNLFLRMWYEVDKTNMFLHARNKDEALASEKRWFPYNKGGDYRKWYGNNDFLVNWKDDGADIKKYLIGKNPNIPRGESLYFKECFSWSLISSADPAFRYKAPGNIFDIAGMSCFSEDKLFYLMALCNSKIALNILRILAPTINFQAGDIANIPVLSSTKYAERIDALVKKNIQISKEDWDCFEVSWDFKQHPLISIRQNMNGCSENILLSQCYQLWSDACTTCFNQLKVNEEELNSIFIDIYSLHNEVTPEIDNEDVTVRLADKKRDIRSLISYAVGCMFGRYSLDVEGLAFAGGEWDDSMYVTFKADRDSIIPICDDEYFEDDIANRLVRFIEVVYGKHTLEENLQFIADALGGSGQPRDVIRKYFINDFYADHLKIYQKRPIYWLFDSGKKNGFKALVYMHRYQPDTIARMRTDYVHEQQSRYRTAIADLEQRIALAATSERVKLNKKLKTLKDQAAEIQVYEEKIHHLADQYISIDLDDGVKVNYAKFQDVLAKIK